MVGVGSVIVAVVIAAKVNLLLSLRVLLACRSVLTTLAPLSRVVPCLAAIAPTSVRRNVLLMSC